MIPTQHTVDTPYMVGPVHCYTVELDGDLVLFDTGPPTERAQEFLQKEISLDRLKHVIVTHCHLDHYGQSSWLEKNTEATVYLPFRDVLKIQQRDERMESLYQLLTEMGFDEHYLDDLRASFYRGVLFPPLPDNFRIAESDIPERLGVEVLGCAGHSQSDLVYATSEWAITGDTLLKGIFQSPLLDVDLEQGGRFNNYQAYCQSIIKLCSLQDRTILPGHRKKVENVDDIILFYISKTLVRANQIRPYITKYSIAEIINKLFGNSMTDPFHVYLKASEIMFLKDFLYDSDRLKSSLETIKLFAQVSDLFHKALGGTDA
ncbi:MAG: MBL fold metallo-hydrolase [Desulfobulbaceae bacterium]|nr:MAG: MBL fold metallo-hydrolase [Desulfobulbaceae bacterium]